MEFIIGANVATRRGIIIIYIYPLKYSAVEMNITCQTPSIIFDCFRLRFDRFFAIPCTDNQSVIT
jgi:hypothetical protein